MHQKYPVDVLSQMWIHQHTAFLHLVLFAFWNLNVCIWTTDFSHSQLGWLLHNEIGFCLPADSARKVVLGNYVFRVTPWRIDRLCTHVILINLPRQPLFHFANCTLAGLHSTWCEVRLSCSGSPFLQALWWALVSNSQEEWGPATSKWKTDPSVSFLN